MTMTRKMSVEAAVERYLNERKREVSDSTLYNHSSQLKQFTEWAESEAIEQIGDVGPFEIADFRMYRRDEDDVNQNTLYNQMTIIRTFIRWCESRELLEDVSEKIIIPSRKDETRDTKLDKGRGESLLQNLRTFDYGTLRHVAFGILWTTGMRIGSLRAIDLRDYNSDEKYVELVHRPDMGTPLKNTFDGERQVNLHDWLCVIIDDYLDTHRIDVRDGHNREPMFTTNEGRIHRNTLRKRIRSLTRPCEYDTHCPYDRTIDDCEATAYGKASKCPGSVSPHDLRRSAISNTLNEGHSKELVSDRMDVSVDVLEKHYDKRTEDEKREVRRDLFEMN